jgi:uncharacterized protein
LHPGRFVAAGESPDAPLHCCAMEARRLRRLPRTEVCEVEVPVARSLRARLLGLALLDRRRAGPGLLIPRCRSVHTFGMRFAIDVAFLDESGSPLRVVYDLPPCRVASFRRSGTVLEVPAGRMPNPIKGRRPETNKETRMSIIDKLTGRAKKAAGDLADDPSLRREGRREERKGEAKEKRDRAEEAVEEKSEEVADLERKT